MKLKSIKLEHFQCFGDEPTIVDLSEDVTALVGANGSGKTALLVALTRLFGVTQDQRTVKRSDFHVAPGAPLHNRSPRSLFIEVVIAFPELSDGRDQSDSVPPTFNHMIVDTPGGDPFCRVRLEAEWTDDGTMEGSVDQNLYWILTPDELVPDDKKVKAAPHDRGLIQVHYIPANRDPAPELSYAARSRTGRLVRAVSWADDTRQDVRTSADRIHESLMREAAIGVINASLQKMWGGLRDDHAAAKTTLRFAGAGFEEVVKNFGVVFRPDENGGEQGIEGLSDGQQSLFYLALVATVFDVESSIIDGSSVRESPATDEKLARDEKRPDEDERDNHGFRADLLRIPALTVFALEEPENHLAPHYLARIIGLLRSLTWTGRAQSLFSSHSPAVLGRVNPEEIRHFRLDIASRTSVVKRLTLPDSAEESGKYVREAVVAYPELYFGKFVILAEGPSEEVVLPKMADAAGFEIDKSFVCIVPLGGRHVNHFWRLLNDLRIPHATLLDLDAGREGGGWARVKYACQQLIGVGADPADVLHFKREEKKYHLTEGELETLQEREVESTAELMPWLRHLETFRVYFSGPLDFDLAMLRRFPDAYKVLEGQPGPSFPDADSPERDSYIEKAVAAAVGGNEPGCALYANSRPEWKELFPWYRYLFLSRSKPATHLQAMARIAPEALWDNAPSNLKRLLRECEKAIAPMPVDDGATGPS